MIKKILSNYFDAITSKIILETTVKTLRENKVESFFPELMRRNKPYLKFDGWSVIEFNEINRPTFVSVSDNYRKYDLSAIERKLAEMQNPLFHSVLREKKWKYVGNISKIHNWVPTPRVYSWIGIPLFFGQEVFGVLNLDYFKCKKLTFKDRLILDNFQKNFSRYSSDFNELKELFYQKYIDHLTGLKNRHFLEEYLKNNKNRIGVIFCDLNKFKSINDTYGHRVGDEVLKIVARRLKNVLKSTDEVIRYGGDEFVVLTQSVDNIESIILRIKNAIRKYSIIIENKKLNLGISCGYSIYPDDGKDLWEIVHIADLRMYSEKGER